ncbi:MAG: ABC transporter ATP-binding protein [bacterium]
MLALKTVKLRKEYITGFRRKKIVSLDSLNLEVEEGQIFGYLGPNGAGKTTTIKIIMGIIHPTSGSAKLLGKDFKDIEIKKEIGFLPEQPYFYDYLTAQEFLNFYGNLAGLLKKERQKRTDELLELVNLKEKAKEQLRRFSKGMLQRIGIAQAIINNPRLVVLDEPQSGLDPIGRKEVRDIIINLKEQGKTVFFSSHILSDAEMICDQVAILVKGKVREIGQLEELLEAKVKSTEVLFDNINRDEILKQIENLSGNKLVKRINKILAMINVQENTNKVVDLVRGNGGNIISVTPRKETLEELFIEKVGDA